MQNVALYTFVECGQLLELFLEIVEEKR
jgi:hypothetical protein